MEDKKRDCIFLIGIAGQNIHARPYDAIARLKSAPLKNKSEEIVDELRRRFETLEKP